jgi:D-glycero-D-manno-heptose 1,7-bisphosphate phosphatase
VRRAVFLDRDGVLNASVIRQGKPYPPDSIEELTILPGVSDALRNLRDAGFINIVVTNQPDVGAGKQQVQVVEAMNNQLREALPLDDVKVCYHTDNQKCDCRKPNPGMLLEAAKDHGIDLRQSFLVGDRWRDVAAGQAAGCSCCFFVDYEYHEQRPEQPYIAVKSLSEAAAIILSTNFPREQ